MFSKMREAIWMFDDYIPDVRIFHKTSKKNSVKVNTIALYVCNCQVVVFNLKK